MSLGFLHLSDLRIGADEDVEGPILAGLVEQVAEERSEGRPLDLIIIAGGLARSGKAAEYAAVTSFCDRLLDAAGLAGQRERLVVVPGDFDVDLSVARGLTRTLTPDQAEEYFAPGGRGPHFAKVAAFEAWRRQYFSGRREPPEGSTCGPLIRLALQGEEVVLLPINTVLFATRSKDHGELWVGQAQLRRSHKAREFDGASLRLAVLHHPLAWLHPAEQERARNTLGKTFDALLHGHTPQITTAEHGVGTGGTTPQISPGRTRGNRSGSAYFGEVVDDLLHLDPITYSDHIERWHEDTSRKLDPLRLTRRQPPPGASEGSVELRAGTVLALRYCLDSPLGKGGFGWVWRVLDIERRKTVALKVFREGEAFGDKRRLQRFFRGAELIAGIEHPTITRVLAPEVRAHGHAFSVMEFVDGQTLDAAYRGEPLTELETLRTLIELGEGLAAAHCAEVIHRDLKPHNILVDRSGALKVIDFDTATPFEGAEYTLTTLHVASPIYSAPEVLNRHASDARADIYSLAATGFFLLTGRDPQHGVSLEEQLRDDVQTHASEPLRAALAKACARFPERRFRSMDAFVSALRRIVSASKDEPPVPALEVGAAGDESPTPALDVPAPENERTSPAAGLSVPAAKDEPPTPALDVPAPEDERTSPAAGLSVPAAKDEPPTPALEVAAPEDKRTTLAGLSVPQDEPPPPPSEDPTPAPESPAPADTPSTPALGVPPPKNERAIAIPAGSLVPAPQDDPPTPAPEVSAEWPEPHPGLRARARLFGFLGLMGVLMFAVWMKCHGDRGAEAGLDDRYQSSASADAALDDTRDAEGGTSLHGSTTEVVADVALPTTEEGPTGTTTDAHATTTSASLEHAPVAGTTSSSATANEPAPPPSDPPKKKHSNSTASTEAAKKPEPTPSEPKEPEPASSEPKELKPASEPEKHTCPSGMKYIAGGRFKGKYIAGFCMDTTEVTVAAYKPCVERGSCTEPDKYDPQPAHERYCNYGNEERERHPVNCVDWLQARTYCIKGGKRLPSEEEWEWAARGREEARSYPWEEKKGASCKLAVMAEGLTSRGGCGKERTWAVGSKKEGASRDGLLDMSGNVWEWTSTASGRGRALRGGGWNDNYHVVLSVFGRSTNNPDVRFYSLGFRCARSAR